MTTRLPVRKTIRLKNYDYSQPGYYFITICTQSRINRFGNIENGKMILNVAGKMVESVWFDLPKQFPTISLDTFQIMPNHIHGIIKINTPVVGPTGDSKKLYHYTKSKTLGDIVGAFKSIVTNRYSNGVKLHLVPPFHKKLLQFRFHEHIIRNDVELFRIRQYIKNNPIRWHNARLNTISDNYKRT